MNFYDNRGLILFIYFRITVHTLILHRLFISTFQSLTQINYSMIQLMVFLQVLLQLYLARPRLISFAGLVVRVHLSTKELVVYK